MNRPKQKRHVARNELGIELAKPSGVSKRQLRTALKLGPKKFGCDANIMILVEVAEIHVKKIRRLWKSMDGDRDSVERAWANFA